ncbi:MAG: discoidin domain-containing protein [Odoribacter sp.]|nr:discoidin domain-containing protein [Odoribacter sp.]
MATLPPYEGEPFWLTWNGSLIGNTDPLTQADLNKVVITLPDDTYNLIAGQVPTRSFTVYDFYGSDDESYLNSMEGKPENIFDGIVNNNLSGNGYWVSPYVQRPVYNPQPWIIVDMGNIHNLNKFSYRHRNNANIQVNAHTIQVEVCTDIERGNWTDLGEFVLPSTLKEDHEYEIPVTAARYVKFTFIKGQLKSGKTEWDYTENGSVSVDEIKFYEEY